MVELTQVFNLPLGSACGAFTGPISNSQVFYQFAWNRRATSFYATRQMTCGRFTWRRRPAMSLCNRAQDLEI